MYYKVITCLCYANVIIEKEFGSGNIVKQLLNFHCECNVPHDYKVWVYGCHPWFCSPPGDYPSNCSCKNRLY